MNFYDLSEMDELTEKLSKEQLHYYFERYKTGDKLAKKEIANHSIKLVIYCVQKNFSNTYYRREDLISLGSIGLLKSIDTYDESRGIEFSTYASACINNEILMFFRREKKHHGNYSLDKTLDIKNDSAELEFNAIISSINSDFVSDYEDKETFRAILYFIETLPKLEKDIVKLYFGLADGEQYNQKDISLKFGLSQSYVSRILKRAINKIKIEMLSDAGMQRCVNDDDSYDDIKDSSEKVSKDRPKKLQKEIIYNKR